MRTKFKFILWLTALFLACQFAVSSEYDWKLVRDEDGIQVYLQKYWADNIKAFQGIVYIHSSIDSILAVILDINACPDWVHNCRQPHLLMRKSFSECYHYQIHQLPFPASDREFILHSEVSRSGRTGAISIHTRAEPEFCEENNSYCADIPENRLIRVYHSHGLYLLEPVAQRITRVTWTHHTNPEGKLPGWLINSLIRDVPFHTLNKLRAKVRQEKYRKARIEIDQQGKIINLIYSP